MELTLFQHKECFLYLPTPLSSAMGHRAQQWNLAKPIATTKVAVVLDTDSDICIVRFMTKEDELFAESRFSSSTDENVDQAIDSSRYFVVTVREGEKRSLLGMGFRDRDTAFDFKVALQDVDRRRKKEVNTEENQASEDETETPHEEEVDMSLHGSIHVKLFNKSARRPASNTDTPSTVSSIVIRPPGDASKDVDETDEWDDFQSA